MSLLLQLSDPHFGTERPRVAEALRAFAEAVAPDLIVVSGDVTQRARPAEFAAAADFLARLPACPRLVVPGNHDLPLFDLWSRLWAPHGGFRRCFGHERMPVLALPGLLAVGVDSTRRWRHKQGALASVQIEAVSRRLRRARPGQLRVVVVHHPLDVATRADEADIPRGAREAVTAWALAGADLVLSGHVHAPLCRPLAERYGPVARGCWTARAGTATSRRLRGGHPNSVNVIRHALVAGERRCSVERLDYDEARGAFRPVAVQAMDIGG